MTATLVFTDEFTTELAGNGGGITASATSFSAVVAPSTVPSAAAGSQMWFKLDCNEDGTTISGRSEYVTVGQITGTSYSSVTRAAASCPGGCAQGAPVAHNDGAYIVATVPAEALSGMLQAAGNLSSVADAGTSRSNLHDPSLTPAAAVATSNVTVTAPGASIDGYPFNAGDLVLLTAQNTASQNGLWVWNGAATALTRPTEFPTGATVKGRFLAVLNGNAYGGSLWALIAPSAGVVVDTGSQTWSNLTSPGAPTDTATVYVATDGNDSNWGYSWIKPKATIAAALAALPANGGTVAVGGGTFNVSSTARTDSVSLTVNSTTVTDTSCVSGDVGSYVAGPNCNGEIPQILTVNPGVSFTTDVPCAVTGGTAGATTLLIFKPAYVLPAGVRIVGRGSGFGNSSVAEMTAGTRVIDSGTGITCLSRGGTYVSNNLNPIWRYGHEDIMHYGSSTALAALLLGNFSWAFVGMRCDYSGYAWGGLLLDANMNQHSFYDCYIHNNGVVNALVAALGSGTHITGGILGWAFSIQPSAAINFWNCNISANVGWNVAAVQGNQGVGGFNFFNCTDGEAIASAATPSGGFSGTSMWLYSGPNGMSTIMNGWSESNSYYDLQTYGPVSVVGHRFQTYGAGISGNPGYHWFVQSGTPSAVGCTFQNQFNGSVLLAGGGIAGFSWVGCQTLDTNGLFNGGPADLTGVGSVGTSYHGGYTQGLEADFVRVPSDPYGSYYYGAIEAGQGFGVDAPGVAYGAFNVGVNVAAPHTGGQGGNSALGARINNAATLTSGTGAPTISGNKGDFYFRTDTPGTANQRLYACTTAGAAGTAVWAAIL